jgi:SAM-dependent methyltransferase
MSYEPTYSRIITPEDYNRIISTEHLYISGADQKIKAFVEQERDRGATEVVEIGCGPARILPILGEIERVTVTGIDHDPNFVDYAGNQVDGIDVRLADMKDYQHGKAVDIFVSQGVHHHIPKGESTKAYLQNLSSQLVDGGVYIVGDEFLPEYADEEERKVKAVVWYSHIIAEAQKSGFTHLAREEAKTLLDDLYEGDPDQHVKDDFKIKLILNAVGGINEVALRRNVPIAEERAQELLKSVYGSKTAYDGDDPTVVLSRGDFKICESEFAREVATAGLSIEDKVRVGPLVDIGAMVVYLLRKK